jgi:hypothetical protein
VLEEISVWDLLHTAPDMLEVYEHHPRKRGAAESIDAIHMNCAEWMRIPELFGTHPLYDPDHVIISLRHQDLLAIVDWEERAIVWAWGQEDISGPHDATLLANGNILAFDNGLDRAWSRVIEVDPRTNEIVWQYGSEHEDVFYSRSRGGSQRLTNGNTLITVSGDGRVIEVSPEGDVVWAYQNDVLTEEREPGAIVRMRRFEGVTFEELEEHVRGGKTLPWWVD